MPHMIVIMANPFIQIINIYFLVFFILRDPAKAERDLLQFIPCLLYTSDAADE